MSRLTRIDWLQRHSRLRPRKLAPKKRRLRCEPLENRRLLAVLTVNSELDGPVDLSDNVVTLRDALSAANSDVAISPGGPVGSGADTIEFDNSLKLALIRLTEGQLSIADEVTIDGAELGITITADANGDDILFAGTTVTDVGATVASDPSLLADNDRVINITGTDSNTTLVGLTITGGRNAGRGGGILSQAPLTLTGSTVSGNSTTGRDADGGGIYGDRRITLTGSTISGNSTTGNSASGGGFMTDRDAFITNSTITGNSTTGVFAYGGGALVGANLTLTNSLVAGNVTVNAAHDQIVSNDVTTRQGGTIQGARLRNNDTVVRNDLTVFEIFAVTDEVIDGEGNATGILAGTLRGNGGSTATIALMPDGVAVDSGDANVAAGIDFDQRGMPFTRVFGANIDIGAYEVQPFAVDLLTDESDGDLSHGDVSLREALELTNALPGADTVTFDATLTDGVIRLTDGQLEITDEVIIDGASSGITVSGDSLGDDVLVLGTNITDVGVTFASDPTTLDDNIRVLEIIGAESATTIIGLTITGGRTVNADDDGGGILSAAPLKISNSTVSGNSTAGNNAKGGGIYSVGELLLTNSTLSGNTTTGSSANGGGIKSLGAVALTNSTVSGNSTAGLLARGGGISSDSDVTLSNSLVAGNVANNSGNNQIHTDSASVIRQGGTIQGSVLRDGNSTVQTGLTAPDIFAHTTLTQDARRRPRLPRAC